jgi:hypothetical protein
MVPESPRELELFRDALEPDIIDTTQTTKGNNHG